MSTVVRARIDEGVKTEAQKALDSMGLTVSDAIRLLMIRIANEKALPFSVQAPNETTDNAISDLESGKGKSFDSTDDLYQDLGI